MTGLIDIADAKWQLRLDGSDEDTQIEGLIERATAFLEQEYEILLAHQEAIETFDGFGPLRLRAWPIAPDEEVEVSYTAADGTEQTIDNARLMASRRPAMVLPAIGRAWPSASEAPGSVTVSVYAGYPSENAPLAIKQAILLLVGHWYNNREASGAGGPSAPVAIPLGVEALMRPYRRIVG